MRKLPAKVFCLAFLEHFLSEVHRLVRENGGDSVVSQRRSETSHLDGLTVYNVLERLSHKLCLEVSPVNNAPAVESLVGAYGIERPCF